MPASAKRILIAPLDWGLGHTTRCIPIIRNLVALGHTVIFAGDEKQQAFVRQSFPQIDTRTLEGYRVRYSRRALMLALLWQFPRLLKTIHGEHHWLRKIVAQEQIDGVISDNRYGLWHPEKPCVILTHQPAIQTGIGKLANAAAQRIHYRFLQRFGAIWIPDLPGYQNLAGALSHPSALPDHCRYIGWLSQFMRGQSAAGNEEHILILLSGPEPQRSILSDKLWRQAMTLKRPVVFVEGCRSAVRKEVPAHIRHIPLAGAKTLQPLLESASLVICRSGYSTLMDLALLKKSAVLIPTPGQTEQEYLARRLDETGIFYTASQHTVSLEAMIQRVESSARTGIAATSDVEDLLLPVLKQWAATL